LTVRPGVSELLIFMDQSEMASLQTAYFFPIAEGVAIYAAPQEVSVSDRGLVLTVERSAGSPTVSDASGVLRLTFNDGTSQAYQLVPGLETARADAAAKTPVANPGTVPAPLPVWQAVLFALVGGLILNLMPCVFPVLSLKAFSFVSANYKTAANRQREGWAYTLGIWASFIVIVIVLLALRAGGSAIGWGFQLQEPVFVAFMTILMVLVALSLSGMFNIQFGVEGAGQSLAAREGIRGAFFKGVLAALVATPCTAPFMAPAIGFALTQPVMVVLLIFSFLALGMALPFLLLSYSPALARMMPRPGAWMETVKQGLAFPMYLTAAWLLYVFDRSVGAVGTLILLAAVIFIVFAIWLWRQGTGLFLRGTAILVVLVSAYAVITKQWEDPGAEEGYSVPESAYSEAALAKALESGAPVFAYFTADWCITCKVNERVALFTDRTQAAFRENRVQLVKGDWTNRNAEIGALLARFGRAGVPLYLYFPAGASEPVVLPEILGPGTITDVLDAN
jgi:thiol:disulfide interchange protein DsbD